MPEAAKILVTGDLTNDSEALKLIAAEAAYQVELLRPEDKDFCSLPLNEYAANAGSTQMEAVAGREGDGNGHLYHYISLENIARERKVSKKQGNILVRLVVPLAILVGVGALLFAYQSRGGLQADIKQLQEDLAQANTQYQQVQAAADHARSVEGSINTLQAQTKTITSRNQSLLGSKNYVSDVASIVQALPYGVSYLSLSIDAGRITINGEAISASLVVQFSRNLEAYGGYKLANITSIGKPHAATAGMVFPFTIIIQR